MLPHNRRDALKWFAGLLLGAVPGLVALRPRKAKAAKPVPVVPAAMPETMQAGGYERKYVQTHWPEFIRTLKCDCGHERPIAEAEGALAAKKPGGDIFDIRACCITTDRAKLPLNFYTLIANEHTRGVFAFGLCPGCHCAKSFRIIDTPVDTTIMRSYVAHKFDASECGEIVRHLNPLTDEYLLTWTPPRHLLELTGANAKELHAKMPLEMLRAVIRQETFTFAAGKAMQVIGPVGCNDEDRFMRFPV